MVDRNENRQSEMPQVIGDRLVEITRLLLGSEELSARLERVMALACGTIDSCDEVSVSLVDNGDIRTAASTSDVIRMIDEVQYRAGEGPCVQAVRDGTSQTVASVIDDGRWPAFSQTAARYGFHSAHSSPLMNGEGSLGAFNMYGRAPGAFDEQAIRIGQLFGEQAGIALHHARLYESSVSLAEQLQEALTSRAAIDQAKGVLMERIGCDADAAFEALREASQRLNRKVRDIATEIVAKAGKKNRHPV